MTLGSRHLGLLMGIGLLALPGAVACAGSAPSRPAQLLRQARSVEIVQLAPRGESAEVWRIPTPAVCQQRRVVARAKLDAVQRAGLARALADSSLGTRLGLGMLLHQAPADADFTVIARGKHGDQEFLLAFPEEVIQWVEPDSTPRRASFEAQAAAIAAILVASFPRDSEVLDLLSVVDWVHQCRYENELFEEHIYVKGVPRVLRKSPCVRAGAAGQAGDTTYVLVEVMLDRTGSVRRARVLYGHPSASEAAAALDCVRDWKFRPGHFDGHALGFRTPVSVAVESR